MVDICIHKLCFRILYIKPELNEALEQIKSKRCLHQQATAEPVQRESSRHRFFLPCILSLFLFFIPRSRKKLAVTKRTLFSKQNERDACPQSSNRALGKDAIECLNMERRCQHQLHLKRCVHGKHQHFPFPFALPLIG